MATFLFKSLPEKQDLLNGLKKNYPEIDPLSLYTHLWFRLASSCLEENLDSYLRKIDFSTGRFLLLMFLEVHPEGMKPSEIASSLNVTQATITGLIDGLTQSEYVLRREHAKDRRACIVALTDKGMEFIRKHRPEFNRYLGGLYAPLDLLEKQEMIKLCEKLYASLKSSERK